MRNYLEKTFNSIHNNGIKFTFSMIRFQILGGKDPRKSPEFIDNYAKKALPEIFRGEILPFDSKAKNYTIDQVYTTYRALLPIDCMIETFPCNKRITVVLDQMDSNALKGGCAGAVALATAFATKANCELRILSRNAPADARAYYKTMQELGITIPNSVAFFSDIDRSNTGDCQFKLLVSENDIFMATSWTTALALKNTSLFTKYYYYILDSDLSFESPGSEQYFSFLPSGVVCITESNHHQMYIDKYHSYLTKDIICLENEGKNNTLAFMEQHAVWKK